MRVRLSEKSEFDLVAKNDIPRSLIIIRETVCRDYDSINVVESPNDIKDCNSKKVLAKTIGIIRHIVIAL